MEEKTKVDGTTNFLKKITNSINLEKNTTNLDAYHIRKQKYLSFFMEDKDNIDRLKKLIYKKISECKNIEKIKKIECILNDGKLYFKETEKVRQI